MGSQDLTEVCETYHQVLKEVENHNRIISIDKNSGIQALYRKISTKAMKPGELELIEFEYIRYGTLSLIANFDIVTGQIISFSKFMIVKTPIFYIKTYYARQQS